MEIPWQGVWPAWEVAQVPLPAARVWSFSVGLYAQVIFRRCECLVEEVFIEDIAAGEDSKLSDQEGYC